LDHLLEQNRALIASLETISNPTWDTFITPMSEAGERLNHAWGMVSHLNGVMDTPELRAAYNAALPRLSEYWSALGQNLALYQQYKAIAASPAYADFSPARKAIIAHQLRSFRLSGAELGEQEKVRFAEIQELQSTLSAKFSENVLDATNDFVCLIEDESEIEGLPQDVKQAAAAHAEKAGKKGYQFSLHIPSLGPVLQYAKNRALREKMYAANVTRASDAATVFSKNTEWDNTDNMLQLLRLRAEEAKLLGYANAVELSLVPKMAPSAQHVIDFLQDLAQRARPFAEKDLQELREFARNELDLPQLESWDVGYASEKLREKRYAFSSQEVKKYFREEKVLAGLFQVLQTLFNIDIREEAAPAWHPDVKFFHIERAGKLIGQFYLDLYARSGKRGGAWMNSARHRRLRANGLQTPLAFMICNFSAPVVVDGVKQPVLFNHSEVNTLFHEFGHGIHHLLTQVDELEVAGINGVEWDAVELPSQMMENFCWEWEVLQNMTAHIDTGEPLPRALYDKMLAAKNFQSGLAMLRQIEFALIDIRLHHQFEPSDGAAIQAQLDQLRREIAVFIPPAYNRFLHAFTHIFAGGYAAGYYSYKWAEVLSSDAFAAFEEQAKETGSVLRGDAGQRFLHEVLEMGSVRPALESFKAFRGREPQIDALLRHNGLAA
ncbi:MAG: M3 family metallopeptidase, partial [Burkholderiales bacterium]|nr:M3 family metallopeptidase [Burkholderiales bacterium]